MCHAMLRSSDPSQLCFDGTCVFHTVTVTAQDFSATHWQTEELNESGEARSELIPTPEALSSMWDTHP